MKKLALLFVVLLTGSVAATTNRTPPTTPLAAATTLPTKKNPVASAPAPSPNRSWCITAARFCTTLLLVAGQALVGWEGYKYHESKEDEIPWKSYGCIALGWSLTYVAMAVDNWCSRQGQAAGTPEKLSTLQRPNLFYYLVVPSLASLITSAICYFVGPPILFGQIFKFLLNDFMGPYVPYVILLLAFPAISWLLLDLNRFLLHQHPHYFSEASIGEVVSLLRSSWLRNLPARVLASGFVTGAELLTAHLLLAAIYSIGGFLGYAWLYRSQKNPQGTPTIIETAKASWSKMMEDYTGRPLNGRVVVGVLVLFATIYSIIAAHSWLNKPSVPNTAEKPSEESTTRWSYWSRRRLTSALLLTTLSTLLSFASSHWDEHDKLHGPIVNLTIVLVFVASFASIALDAQPSDTAGLKESGSKALKPAANTPSI